MLKVACRVEIMTSAADGNVFEIVMFKVMSGISMCHLLIVDNNRTIYRLIWFLLTLGNTIYWFPFQIVVTNNHEIPMPMHIECNIPMQTLTEQNFSIELKCFRNVDLRCIDELNENRIKFTCEPNAYNKYRFHSTHWYKLLEMCVCGEWLSFVLKLFFLFSFFFFCISIDFTLLWNLCMVNSWIVPMNNAHDIRSPSTCWTFISRWWGVHNARTIRKTQTNGERERHINSCFYLYKDFIETTQYLEKWITWAVEINRDEYFSDAKIIDKKSHWNRRDCV